jgi:hypothetical protein
MNRIAAEQRTSRAQESGEPRGTTRTGSYRTRSDELPAAQHAAHPERVGNSEVRHAEPPTGKQAGEGEGGYPGGEYDVAEPRTKGPASTQDVHESLLEAHFQDVDLTVLEELLGQDRRLDDSELPFVLEALPVGAALEHEGPNRWRVRAPTTGGNRFGHGATAVHAIEAFILGDTAASEPEAAAQRFLRLPKAQQDEIRERDRLAAERVGGTADTFARDEAIKAAEADKAAKAPAPNAVTDGPERASARAEQSRKGRQNVPGQPSTTASKSASKRGSTRSGKKK